MLERMIQWGDDHPMGATACAVGFILAMVGVIVGLIVVLVPEPTPGVVRARTEAAAIEWAKSVGYEDPKVVCDDYAASMNDNRSVGCTLATERGGRLQALRCSAHMGTSAACRIEVSAP